jgi:hypothetical protein
VNCAPPTAGTPRVTPVTRTATGRVTYTVALEQFVMDVHRLGTAGVERLAGGWAP